MLELIKSVASKNLKNLMKLFGDSSPTLPITSDNINDINRQPAGTLQCVNGILLDNTMGDFIRIPLEVVKEIIALLDLESMANLASSNKCFNHLIQSTFVSVRFIKQDVGGNETGRREVLNTSYRDIAIMLNDLHKSKKLQSLQKNDLLNELHRHDAKIKFYKCYEKFQITAATVGCLGGATLGIPLLWFYTSLHYYSIIYGLIIGLPGCVLGGLSVYFCTNIANGCKTTEEKREQHIQASALTNEAIHRMPVTLFYKIPNKPVNNTHVDEHVINISDEKACITSCAV